MRSYFVRSIVLSKNKQVKICLPMSAKLCALNHLTLWSISLSFLNEWFSIVDIAYIGLIMAYLWGLISVITYINLAYDLQNEAYV